MAIILAEKYSDLIDERFTEVAKSESVVNDNFAFDGVKTVKVFSCATVELNDYNRTNSDGNRYGKVEDLANETETLVMTQDKSFTYTIDKCDSEESRGLEVGKTIDRQMRDVVIPYVDAYRFKIMSEKAGNIVEEDLTAQNIYEAITTATEALDDASVPELGREILVTPKVYKLMKLCPQLILSTELSEEQIASGIIAEIDGMGIKKVTTKRLPQNANFIVTHPVATCSPKKFEDIVIHENPQGYSGELVEFRMYFDAFVTKNKRDAIYFSKAPVTKLKK